MLAKQVLAVIDALDELSFAAEQAGRDTTAIAATKQAFSDLRKRLEETPPSSARATLDSIEEQMAKVLRWSSAWGARSSPACWFCRRS